MPTESAQIEQLELRYDLLMHKMWQLLWLQRVLLGMLVFLAPLAWLMGETSVPRLVWEFALVLAAELVVWFLRTRTCQDAHLTHLHLTCLQQPKYFPKDEGK